jgi:hypothetical protein
MTDVLTPDIYRAVSIKAVVSIKAILQEEGLMAEWEEKRHCRKQTVRQMTTISDIFTCCYCRRPCRSNIGKISHKRSCSTRN